jgi:hypothetical protein
MSLPTYRHSSQCKIQDRIWDGLPDFLQVSYESLELWAGMLPAPQVDQRTMNFDSWDILLSFTHSREAL